MSTLMTLSDLMIATRQRADMFPAGYTPSTSNTGYFVTDPELISNINQSYFELYDLLTNVYSMWYCAPPLQIVTSGISQLTPLPDGILYSAAPKFYKLYGVDLGLANNSNAWVTLKRFQFIERNKYIYPQLSSLLGIFNPQYDIVGNNLMFIPLPSANQFIQLWYAPTLITLSNLTDTVDGVSGWTEYIINDAAIKCMQKEESDVSVLAAQKMALIKRIEESSINRDIGQPETISDTRTRADTWGYGGTNGSWAGY